MNVIPNSPGRRDAAVLLHPQTDWQAHAQTGAFVLSNGDGVYVYDENGRKYLDGMAADGSPRQATRGSGFSPAPSACRRVSLLRAASAGARGHSGW